MPFAEQRVPPAVNATDPSDEEQSNFGKNPEAF
jgi:hypothetical protein